ncbi:MAG TPA: SH3 domain-containing protein [Methylophilaceae bacterium]|nr:SH3 domain-containing protein [Methylophilaceae bacterium]
MQIKHLAAAGILLALLPAVAMAVEFRSIASPKAVLYDAPSTSSGKLYVIGQGYPVEVIVDLGAWIKVRDNLGGLSWVEAKQLATKHTVLVTQDQAELRQDAKASSALNARLEQNVVLEMLAPPSNGWIKVRHRDGLTGYILASSVWGY